MIDGEIFDSFWVCISVDYYNWSIGSFLLEYDEVEIYLIIELNNENWIGKFWCRLFMWECLSVMLLGFVFDYKEGKYFFLWFCGIFL